MLLRANKIKFSLEEGGEEKKRKDADAIHKPGIECSCRKNISTPADHHSSSIHHHKHMFLNTSPLPSFQLPRAAEAINRSACSCTMKKHNRANPP
jgi:hypothetical protein